MIVQRTYTKEHVRDSNESSVDIIPLLFHALTITRNYRTNELHSLEPSYH
jgi:hypothetical protein